jgi:hypothetical protein
MNEKVKRWHGLNKHRNLKNIAQSRLDRDLCILFYISNDMENTERVRCAERSATSRRQRAVKEVADQGLLRSEPIVSGNSQNLSKELLRYFPL